MSTTHVITFEERQSLFDEMQDAYQAQERAKNLLISALDHDQKYTMRRAGFFVVRGIDDRMYRVVHRSSYMLEYLSRVGGQGPLQTIALICVQPDVHEITNPDAMILDMMYLSKTLLETRGGIELMIKTANVVIYNGSTSVRRIGDEFFDYIALIKGTDKGIKYV